jgi:murein L,D-transpeptidase YafK
VKVKHVLVFSVFLVIVLSFCQFSSIFVAKKHKKIEKKNLSYEVKNIDRINKSKSSLEVLKELTTRDVLN